MGAKKVLNVIRANEFYEVFDLPMLTLVSHSKSWLWVVWWFSVLITVTIIGMYSCYQVYSEFRDNPTKTDVANVRSIEVKVPNISLCLTGWPSLSSYPLWSPTNSSTADSPTWPHYLPVYVRNELELMENQGRSIINDHWPYFVFIYVEEYVRILLKIELNGDPVEPWWLDMEKNAGKILAEFAPNATIDDVISKYAKELLYISGCAEKWPARMNYTVWPFVDPGGKDDRCLYITHNLTLSPSLASQLDANPAVLHSCKNVDFISLQKDALRRARALVSFDDSSTSLSESQALFREQFIQCKQTYFMNSSDWCDGNDACYLEETMCRACDYDEFDCGNALHVCIAAEFQCDGETDCIVTGRDEAHCNNTLVAHVDTTGWMRCCGVNGTEPCDPSTRCNGVYDCGLTHEDELDCTSGCGEGGFHCGAGQCIPRRFRCDGVTFSIEGGKTFPHCYNGADEVNCSYGKMTSDTAPQFNCDNNNNTIPLYRRCDGVYDCGNKADEANCTIYTYPTRCNQQGYTKCNDTLAKCFFDGSQWPTDSQKCNGKFECHNRADERNCSVCHDGLTTCTNAVNISFIYTTISQPLCYSDNDRCDGHVDCDDSSDERDCSADIKDYDVNDEINSTNHTINDTCDHPHAFNCGDGQCIPNVYKCNGISDCFNYADESAVTCATNTNVTDVCELVAALLPTKCDSRTAPSAHTRSCLQHRMPWRQRGQFMALKRAHNFRLLCDGNNDCNKGIDELAYICGNYRLISTTRAKLQHMSLTMDPNCPVPVGEVEVEPQETSLGEVMNSNETGEVQDSERRKRQASDIGRLLLLLEII